MFSTEEHSLCSGCDAGWRAKRNISDIEKTVEILRLVSCKRDLVLKHNMPPPPNAIYTVQEVLDNTTIGGVCDLKFPITHTNVDPCCSGIYFLWEHGEIVYVGSSKDIRARLLGHPKAKPNAKVSWLSWRLDSMRNAECFYIWSLSPKLNGETISDLEHTEYNNIAKEIEF